jgi:glyoxylase-like metal-dependent hydrolase (beta-lactamase superfamily II)
LTRHVVENLEEHAGIRRFSVRTPTLPPATHTNVYVVGRGRLGVIDPASPWDDEQARLDAVLDGLAAAGEQVAEVILTHHHVDHVSGAMHLAGRLGVGIAAHEATAAKLRGRVDVTRLIRDGEQLEYGLRAMLTPGHAPGHLCFIDDRTRAVIAGDMVASVGTIIVEPEDDGDMRLYLDSLRALRALDASVLFPAHGPPIDDANAKLDFYVKHRLEREGRVLAALTAAPQTLAELVPPSYPDVPPQIYPLAARSLLAHLLKLQADGRAARDPDDRWRRV